MSNQITVTTILGESRTPKFIYPDGSFECPFCFCAVIHPKTTCDNPACDANPYWTPDGLRARIAKREALAQEETKRKQNHESAMARIRQDRAEEEAWRNEQIAKCKEGGYCEYCLFQPGYKRVKFIKHRTTCPILRSRSRR